eukprot:CAMPEP_0172160122 /NCGR_PEP_ID=MMETSP1050-20130122/5382_1 /TAXON_ID=233186 /ORGANISM="Cryptomonas curvata, Strain CCAP979/52" /LENGTH=180 /DNA_ID=CAMNT_0012829849 /DNA_START=122 /DNA_END=661 /DNA_ORIENTATION=+
MATFYSTVLVLLQRRYGSGKPGMTPPQDADDVQSPVQVDTAPQPVLAPTVNRSISISEVIEFQPPPRSADGQSSAVPATDSASMASSPQLPFDSQAGTSFPAGPGGPDSDSGSSSASCAVVEPVLGSYISNPTPARSSRPTWKYVYPAANCPSFWASAEASLGWTPALRRKRGASRQRSS